MSEQANEVLQKVEKLVRLGLDAPDSEESRNAAIQALQLIKEHKLAIVPVAALENSTKAVEGMRGELARVRQEASRESTQKMFIGAGLGLLASKFLKI